MTLAKQNEDSFMQRAHINTRYGVNCSKLTLWEYFLLVEQAIKQSKNNG